MTREEIMRLQGRELDAAVAEHVMGWVWYGPPGYEYLANPRTDPNDDPDWGILPRYSSDIAAAWQVVEEMNRRGFVARIEVASNKAEQYDPATGVVKLVADGVAWVDVGFGRDDQEVHRNLYRFIDVPVPTAICRAALLSVCGEAGDDG